MDPAEIDAQLNKIPEFNLPDPDCLGRFECPYCKVKYENSWKYNYHMKIRKRCKDIRRALNVPILEDRKFTCRKCGRDFASKAIQIGHEWNCVSGFLTTKPYDGGEEAEDKPSRED